MNRHAGFLKILALLLLFGMSCGEESSSDSGSGGARDCQAGQTRCGGVCVDPATSSAHCGACSSECAAGSHCVAGACACQPDLTSCGTSCVDVVTDVNHCGECGIACQPGQACRAAACECQSGLTVCDETCSDTTSDASNCGSCGNVCAAPQVCSQGQCATSCAAGLWQCGSSCVDPNVNVRHCGSCNNACPAGQSCNGGTCGCATGELLCGGQCVNPNQNVLHCGSCGNGCTGGRSCEAGSCVCPDGQAFCSGSCVPIATDPSNCGRCANSCPTGTSCSAGNCGGGSAGAAGSGGASGASGSGGSAGSSGSGGSGGSSGTGDASVTGGSAGAGGSTGQDGSVGSGGSGAVGSGGTGGSLGLTLSAIPANTTIGLDWARVAGATSYRVYFSTTPSVNPATASSFDSTEPATVHRGLNNGTTYYYVVSAIIAGNPGPPSSETSATPAGEWVLEELGAGDFNDVQSGGRVPRLAPADRVQIVLLPEGYVAADLGVWHTAASHSGTRANDVDRWVDEVFRIEPFSLFREAFVIWYLPRASSAHMGQGSTAFGVQVASGAVSSTSAAAAPLWGALDAAGGDAFAFPPGSTVTNHIASFMIFDASRGRAGYSGLTTTLTNPSSSQQRIRSAFALGHAHEFGHAFSNVRDEYLENDNTVTSTSETSNVAHTNSCGVLPWAHLLQGAGINQTASLVGAFGRPQRGYHSELHCLMNGTHDNGEYYCGPGVSLNLRVNDRMCNFCREITAYRVFDRTGLLPGTSGFSTWKTDYRSAFYQRFGFRVPSSVPQTLACPSQSASAVYEACVP